MNQEEKFDELLSSKLSERDFPFDELNWDDAERLIIQQENRSRITRFSLIFSAGLATGALIMLPFIISTHNNISNTPVVQSNSNQTPVTQNNVSAPVNQLQTNTNNTANKEVSAPLPVQSAFVKKDTRAGTRGTSSNIVSTTKEHQPMVVASVNNSQRNLLAKSNVLASTGKMNNESGHIEAINQKNVNSAEQINKTPVQSTNNTVADNVVPTTITTADKNNSTTNTTTTNTTTSNITPATRLNNATASISDSSKKKNDSTTNITNSPPMPMIRGTEPYIKNDYSTTNIISVYAGLNYSFGWSGGDEVVEAYGANGLTPMGGLTFTHYFNSPLSASIGVGYSELNKLNTTYTTSIVQYDFGQNADVTTVTPQKIYYLAFPFKFQYNINKKDIVSIGCDYLLLLTTSSIVTTYKQNYFSTTTGTSEKQDGYTQGFNNSNLQLTLSATLMLADRLGITGGYYLGLNTVENSSIPVFNQYARNSGLRLVLSYQLMK